MIVLNHSTVLFLYWPGSSALHWSQWLDAPWTPLPNLLQLKIQECDSLLLWLSVFVLVLSHGGDLNGGGNRRPRMRGFGMDLNSNWGGVPGWKKLSCLAKDEAKPLWSIVNSPLGEEPPNNRAGMWVDGRSIRMFNQEGRPGFCRRKQTRTSCWPVRHSDIAA